MSTKRHPPSAIPRPVFEDSTGLRRTVATLVILLGVALAVFVSLDFTVRAVRLPALAPLPIAGRLEAPAAVAPRPLRALAPEDADCAAVPRARQALAYLPASDPLAASSLALRCGRLDRVLAEAFVLQDPQGSLRAVADWRGPLADLPPYGPAVVPVLTVPAYLDHAAVRALLSDAGQVGRLGARVALLTDGTPAAGLCLDLSAHDRLDPAVVASALAALVPGAGPSCLIAPVDSPLWLDSDLVEGLDLAVAQAFRVDAAPTAPPAPAAWRHDALARLRDAVPQDRLVVALGGFGRTSRSGDPQVRAISVPEAMEQAAEVGSSLAYVPEAGAARMRYLDDSRRVNEAWVLDGVAAAATLADVDPATAVAVWPLGSEDPAVWSLLAGADAAAALSAPVDLSHLLRVAGQGPFVASLVPAVPGQRSVVLDPEGQPLSSVFVALPRANALTRAGAEASDHAAIVFRGLPDEASRVRLEAILRSHDVTATFVLYPGDLSRRGDVAARLVAAGHLLAMESARSSALGGTLARVGDNGDQIRADYETGLLVRGIWFDGEGDNAPDRLSASELELVRGYLERGFVPILGGLDAPLGQVGRDTFLTRAGAELDDVGQGLVAFDLRGTDPGQVMADVMVVLRGLRLEGFAFAPMGEAAGLGPAELMPPGGDTANWHDSLVFASSWIVTDAAESVFLVLLVVVGLRSVVYLGLSLVRRPRTSFDPDYRPPVAVLVPAFNEERVIASCLRSILASRYDALEVVVIDDGSTDGTAEVVEREFAGDPRVRLIRQANAGKWRACNAGLAAIDAPFFVVADADSVFLPDTIAWLVQQFRDPTVGAVAGLVEVGNHRNLMTSFQTIEYIVSQSVMRRAYEVFEGILVVPGAAGAWRTQAVIEAGLFSGDTVTEDADLTLAVHRAGYRIRFQEQARAVTEVPETARPFLRQRLRWTFGMFQMSWKHRGAVAERRPVGMISLVESIWFNVAFSLLAPFVDLYILTLLARGLWAVAQDGVVAFASIPPIVLVGFFGLTVLDLLNCAAAFRFERRWIWRLLPLVPLLRFGYRQLLYVATLQAIWRALVGELASWNKLARTGGELLIAQARGATTHLHEPAE